METKVISSKQFSLQWRDYFKSALLSALIAVLTAVQQSLDKGEFVFNWKTLAMVASGAFVGKLLISLLQKDRAIVIPGADTDLKEATKQIKRVV